MPGFPASMWAAVAQVTPEYRKIDWGEADDIGGQVHLFPEEGGSFHQHAHPYPHLSIIIGAARLHLDGLPVAEYHGVKCVEIEAGKAHRFEILKAGTAICCIHNTARHGPLQLQEP